MDDRFTTTPEPPYYLVSFTNQMSDQDEGYHEMGDAMFELSKEQPGCYGFETTRDVTGLGITITYWDSEESIKKWKANIKHLTAQRKGMDQWYSRYSIRVAKVERAYTGPEGRDAV